MASGNIENFKKIQELTLALYEMSGQGLRYHQFVHRLNSDFYSEVRKDDYFDPDTLQVADMFYVEDTAYIAFLEKRYAKYINIGKGDS